LWWRIAIKIFHVAFGLPRYNYGETLARKNGIKIIKIRQNMKGREKMLKIYLDNCCYNRPFDVLTQERLRLESEAIVAIVKPIKSEF